MKLIRERIVNRYERVIAAIRDESQLGTIRRALWRIHCAANLKKLSFFAADGWRDVELSLADVNHRVARGIEDGRIAFADQRHSSCACVRYPYFLFSAAGVGSWIRIFTGLVLPLLVTPSKGNKVAARREH